MSSADVRTTAVRGVRLALALIRAAYGNGFENEVFVLMLLDDGCQLPQRAIMFDPDEDDAAIVELDGLHAEIEDTRA